MLVPSLSTKYFTQAVPFFSIKRFPEAGQEDKSEELSLVDASEPKSKKARWNLGDDWISNRSEESILKGKSSTTRKRNRSHVK